MKEEHNLVYFPSQLLLAEESLLKNYHRHLIILLTHPLNKHNQDSIPLNLNYEIIKESNEKSLYFLSLYNLSLLNLTKKNKINKIKIKKTGYKEVK
jgi:hypothetical protein